MDKDPNQISNIEELRKVVNESGSKMRFLVKIFYILQFVKNHPDSMDILGASWCEDNFHFVANSQKLGEFLKIKPNTVNTNFRAHQNKIISCSTSELKKEFPIIIETRHWKKRYSKDHLFNYKSTIKEVEQIKMLTQNIDSFFSNIQDSEQPSAIIEDNIFHYPDETFNLLKNDRSQLFNLSQMYFTLSEDDTFFSKFLDFITNLWKSKINPNGNTALIQSAISILLNKDPSKYEDYDDDDIDPKTEILEKNLSFLLPQNFENSQICDYVSFSSFARHFMRYCDHFDMCSTLNEISNLSDFDYDNSSFKFQSWFKPTASKMTAIDFLKKQEGESWVVIPSTSANKFTLLLSLGESLNISALHIKHNPIPSKPEERYSVEFNDSEKYYPTFDSIFKALNLKYPEVQAEKNYNINISYVSADNIANRNNNSNYNNSNNNGNNNFYESSNSYANDISSYNNYDTGIQGESQQNYDFMEFGSQSQEMWSLSQNSQIGFSQDLGISSQTNDNENGNVDVSNNNDDNNF